MRFFSKKADAFFFCGVFLILIGILGYVNVMSDRQAIRRLFRFLLLFGVIAQAKENLRKHLMHAAVVVALLGFIATPVRLLPRLGELTFSGAEIAQISMAAVCLLFVVLAVKSFVGARRKVSFRIRPFAIARMAAPGIGVFGQAPQRKRMRP